MRFELSTHRFAPESATILMISGVIAAFHLGKVSPALPTLQASLGLSPTQAGFLLSLMQFAGACIGVFMGLLSDRLGARRSIIIGQLLLCLAGTLALAVNAPMPLLILRMVESCGLLMVVLPTPGLIRSLVPKDQISFRLGLWGCYMALGTTFALALGPAAIDTMGWKGWWLVPSVASLFCVIALATKVPTDSTSGDFDGGIAPGKSQLLQKLHSVLSARGPWFIGIAFAMYAGQWIAIIGFLPSIYVDAGMTKANAGLLTALASLINIVGNVAAAFLIHRGAKKRHLLMVGYLFILTMTAVAFAPTTSGFPVLRYIAILFFSAAGGLIPATLFILAVESSPTETATAASVGWVQQLSAMGMLLMPPILAKIADIAGGWHLTWLATGVAAIVGLLLSSSAAQTVARNKAKRAELRT